ncbi:hypothetical protein Pcinc_002812 [Petrolisthes cinctipes]|uniref:Craniofacial development protein 2-like n=1 Tax=Petrolisthes cinctipes TaxID=88211 RepID=A0AAE1L1X2_PETCI|nr:hypothetical protein Pcinc_002812 [Petrolisthes cinctipes]
MIEGKSERYKLFWIGNDKGTGGVGIFLAEKWVDKVIEVNRVSNRIIQMKLMVGETIFTAISVYVPQCGLSEEAKDWFYDRLIAVASKVSEKEVLAVAGDFNGHVGKTSDGFEEVHEGNGYGERNTEGERILEFGFAMDMLVANTVFKKRESHLVTYESGTAKTQVDYLLVRKKDRKLLSDVKVIPSEEIVTQHKPVVCDFKVKKVCQVKRKFIPRRKIWRLNEEQVKREFKDQVDELLGTNPRTASGSVEEQWKKLKDTLLTVTEQTCGWTKGPPRHKVTWWWNEEVENSIKEKRKLWSDWKRGLVNKEMYLVAKRTARRAIYKAKTEAEKARFADILRRDDEKNEVFRIAKQMAKTNQDIVGEKCIRNDDGVLAINEQDKKDAWKCYYERLLNTEFPRDRENLEVTEAVDGLAIRIEKEMVREAHWVHKKCSGITGRLKDDKRFMCKRCKKMAVADDSDIEKVYLDGEAIEVVEKFCYLGDTIGAQGGAGAGVMARVRRGWSKFRELLPLLTSRALPLLTKGRVYQACVRSVMMYGSETWPLNAQAKVEVSSHWARQTEMLIKRLVTPMMKQLNDHLDKMVGVPRRTVEYHGRRATSERQNAGATKLPDDDTRRWESLAEQLRIMNLKPTVKQWKRWNSRGGAEPDDEEDNVHKESSGIANLRRQSPTNATFRALLTGTLGGCINQCHVLAVM